MFRIRCPICIKFYSDRKIFKSCKCGLYHYVCKNCDVNNCELSKEEYNKTCVDFKYLCSKFSKFAEFAICDVEQKAIEGYIETYVKRVLIQQEHEKRMNYAKEINVTNLTIKSNFLKNGTINNNESIFISNEPKKLLFNKFPNTSKKYLDCLDKLSDFDTVDDDTVDADRTNKTFLYLYPANVALKLSNATPGGAIVFPIKTNVCVTDSFTTTQTIDFTSLYPSCMVRYNLFDSNVCCNPFLKYYNFDNQYIDGEENFYLSKISLKNAGVFVETYCRFYKQQSKMAKKFHNLLDLRVKIKKTDPGLSTAIKLLLNSVYGCSICTIYPSYNFFIGGSILGFEHVSLIRLYCFITYFGGLVYGGDTDSLHFKIETKYRDIWKNYNALKINTNILKVELENIWILMLMLVKKKYCGWYLKGDMIGIKKKGIGSVSFSNYSNDLILNMVNVVFDEFYNNFRIKNLEFKIQTAVKFLLDFSIKELEKLFSIDYNLIDNFDDYASFSKRSKKVEDYKNWRKNFVDLQLFNYSKINKNVGESKFIVKTCRLNKSIVSTFDPSKKEKDENVGNFTLVCNFMRPANMIQMYNDYGLKIDFYHIYNIACVKHMQTIMKQTFLDEELYEKIIQLEMLIKSTNNALFNVKFIKETFFVNQKNLLPLYARNKNTLIELKFNNGEKIEVEENFNIHWKFYFKLLKNTN